MLIILNFQIDIKARSLLLKETLSQLYKVNFSKIRTRRLQKCFIPSIKSIPNGSTLVIGHAYGSPSSNTLFISPSILKLIRNNTESIDNIIFSGDLFFRPTLAKWKLLRNSISNDINIFVAPGNHDKVKNLPYEKDVFSLSMFGKINYPYVVDINKFSIIIEDSIKTNWLLANETLSKIKKNKNSKLLLIRHNIPVHELSLLANSQEGNLHRLPNVKRLSKIINRPLTIISGDSGAFHFLPRLSCYKYKNLRVILNGLGDIEGDTILILLNGSIYKYEI